MGNLDAEKRELRQRILSLRHSLSLEYRKKANALIADKLSSLPEYRKSQTILYYVDFRGEVVTRDLIQVALKENKRVCVPLTKPCTRELIVCCIDSLSQLRKGNYGVLEPVLDEVEVLLPNEVDFVVQPGVAFDGECNRLGYGGGYYDRFVRKLRPNCLRVALAYECQIVDHVPVDKYDVPVNAVVTEKQIIWAD